ncbi:hypothetical protein ALC62_02789, partial [Cyphomyrmex costatus]
RNTSAARIRQRRQRRPPRGDPSESRTAMKNTIDQACGIGVRKSAPWNFSVSIQHGRRQINSSVRSKTSDSAKTKLTSFQPSASDSRSNDTPLLYVYPPLRIHPRPPMLLAIMVRSHGDKAPVTIGGRQAGPVLAPRACSSVRSFFFLS